jgi:hypothetical protein
MRLVNLSRRDVRGGEDCAYATHLHELGVDLLVIHGLRCGEPRKRAVRGQLAERKTLVANTGAIHVVPVDWRLSAD